VAASRGVHDPGQIVLDLAVSLAAGGDCLADVNQLRAAPGVFGLVASDPTVSRLVAVLAADALGRWRRSTPLGLRPARRRGGWPASTPLTLGSMPGTRWSWMSTRRW